MIKYTTEERGQLNTFDYRCYIKNADTQEIVSPFHDIPLFHNENKNIFNIVIEIPRWTNAKMEISKSEKLNPIIQDIKNGKLRYVNNCFPYHGYIWNYGKLPQTWEDPNIVEKETGVVGDNDPLDVCEIGGAVLERGTVVQVKVLGSLGLIDQGEADWKIICIDVNDPLAVSFNDINDVEAAMPGFLDATRKWFEVYKIPTGNPANYFSKNGKFYDSKFSIGIVKQHYNLWKNFMNGGYKANQEKMKGIRMENTTLDFNTALKMTKDQVKEELELTKPFNPTPAVNEKSAIQAIQNYNVIAVRQNFAS